LVRLATLDLFCGELNNNKAFSYLCVYIFDCIAVSVSRTLPSPDTWAPGI
jgi:hypothetical protein